MNPYRHIAILLLFTVFAVRTVGSIMVSHGFFTKSDIEQQEKQSEEDKDSEKTFHKLKIEATDIVFVYMPVAFSVINKLVFQEQLVTSLPQQYFAVPTPPPWYKS